MANQESINRDPQSTNRSFGYHAGGNTAPGGHLFLWVSVTPGSRRIAGGTNSALAQRDSIVRQYDPTPRIMAVAR